MTLSHTTSRLSFTQFKKHYHEKGYFPSYFSPFCFLMAVACGKKNGEKITYRFAPELNKPVVYNYTSTTEIKRRGGRVFPAK